MYAPRLRHLLGLSLAVLPVVGCSHAPAGAPAARATAGDEAPPQLCPAQSPINIVTSSLQDGPEHHVALHYQTGEETIANLGHTVQVSFAPGSTVEFDDKVYAFRQFHFHTPSEHLVDGQAHAMELHMVHTLEGDEQTYLVIGVLFDEGESNAFLEQFIDVLPQREGEQVTKQPGFVDIGSLLQPDEPYFHYQGSLTTPPYTESVTWMVSERRPTASAAQVQRFRELEGENARMVQPTAGRTIDEV